MAVVCMLLGTALLTGTAAQAEDAFFRVPVDQLKITAGELPKTKPDESPVYYGYIPTAEFIAPYVVLDGEGEVYPSGAREQSWQISRLTTADTLSLRVSKARDVTGTLYLPKSNRSGFQKVRFTVPADKADPKQREAFYRAKEAHYQWLMNRSLPGGSWFRYQTREAQAAIAGKSAAEFEAQNRNPNPDRSNETRFEDTYAVFSGGRAVSENMQLDRLLPVGAPEEPTVELSTLGGISVAEMDWEPLTKDVQPQIDPLAACIPADQHALFFTNFKALLRMMDEAALNGTPVLQAVQPRSESARSRERYEQQLCLTVTTLSRLLGDQVVSSVAFTGSDPYLRTGTDVAILFETKNTGVLKAHLATQHTAAMQAHSDCKKVEGTIGNVKYAGAVSTNRTICSYVAEIPKGVVVTNSLAQLKRIVDTSAGQSESMASLPEYRFFRHRYQRGTDETGLLIVTDKTIRRWCSAKWRIATSRRTRAAAIMSHYQAQFMKDLVNGTVEPHDIRTILQVADLGTLRVTKTGVTSSTYGTLDFQTPIAELEFTKVTKTESEQYDRWRQGYQRNWSQFFDPIALSISFRDDRLLADLTVMPLIDSTQYREFIGITTGSELKPTSGDPHAGSLLHWALAINVKSERLKWANNFLEGPTRVSLLGWLGESISIYADPDPFWSELVEAVKKRSEAKTGVDPSSKFFEENFHRLPVALTAQVADGLKLTLFLAGVRAFIEQTAPGMLQWTSLEHNGQPYVKITATENGRNSVPFAGKLAIHYAATPKMLVVTLNEDLLKRALDRQAAGKKSADDKEQAQKPAAKAEHKPVSEPPRPWLGKSMAFQIDRKVLEVFEEAFGRREYQQLLQARAWSNIPILNEWKRLYVDRDPVAIHQQVWQTTLVCPGGGKYVWNEEYQTMESTVYGHPGQPKTGPALPQALQNVRWLDFGLTFENRGLRANIEIGRSAGK